MKDNIDRIKRLIMNQDKSIICLNDECLSDFEYCREEIINSFEFILPEKSLNPTTKLPPSIKELPILLNTDIALFTENLPIFVCVYFP